ncbi:site-2 protease family protein [Stakelama marina]|uniref:Zinc metalloprotease n=1 Tax=Stakelama marina TaxID=2826939 RepID=A0A8T4I9V2_9SPHN|nr:site-2 protease family protein [Stakelama marina]MBR0551290.1 site-2 protease family protein [Stakelama marina]
MQKRWAISIGSFGGTVVRIHLTFLLLLAWIGLSALTAGGPRAALFSIAFITALFACVVLHEFGHVLAARRYGIPTPDITLYPIGGMARIKSNFEDPRQELVIASAGPAVSLGLAIVLMIAAGGIADPARLAMPSGLRDFAGLLALANLSLFLFNLLPAFPMDGGRIFRAGLSLLLDRDRATRAASWTGRLLGLAIGAYGVAIFHPILMLIGGFVFLAASAEASSVDLRKALSGYRIGDVMVDDVHMLTTVDPLSTAIEALIRGEQDRFPVVDPRGAPVSTISRSDIMLATQQIGLDAPIAQILDRNAVSLRTEASAQDALAALETGADPVFVVDAQGKTIGIVTMNNLAEFRMVRAAIDRPSPRPTIFGRRDHAVHKG